MSTIARHRYTCVGAGFFVAGITFFDLFLTLFCGRLPLLVYLIAAAIGLAVGSKMKTWLIGHGALKKVFKVIALTGCFLGGMSIVTLTLMQPNWDSKCAFRHCNRGLSGLSLFSSPYPVGTLSCSALWLCANEFPLSSSQKVELDRLITFQGCPAP